MEWIFIDLVVGSLALLVAQLIDYVVDSSQVQYGKQQLGSFTTDVPPGDARPAVEGTIWYDQAA